MKKSRKPAEKKFSADQLMSKVASTLVRDFQNNLNDPCFCSDFQQALRTGNLAEIRRLSPTPDSSMDVARFKATYQLQSVLKRYRYQTDIYSDDELTAKAIDAFKETQNRISALDLDNLDESSKVILDLAKIYIANVLGEYSDEEHRDLCRFGRKASVGIPARLACLAARWELPVTGSSNQIKWFDSEMSQDFMVQEYWTMQQDSDLPGSRRSIYREVDSLTLTLVPKTFKSLRAIMPNTTIGSYMSYGLGEMIRKRLRRKGYDIKTLQLRHRSLASQASQHSLLVTADLSSASDSISVALVNRLFPSDWLEILHQSRIGVVSLPDGSSVESLTFCTMGIGYTFPLQTLVFLSLLKAIETYYYGRLDRRTISVYGDDLIYSSRMHEMVVDHFQQFGFVINLDKTFHEGHFRESCGGDYYYGVDVRPFQPQNGPAYVGKTTYEAILYKYVNTLLARWSEYEIASTLDFLTSEIEFVTGKCKLVPHTHPDDSGIKVESLLRKYDFLRTTKCALPKSVGHGLFRFSYLRFLPEEREEKRHGPYYWDALRGGIRQAHIRDCYNAVEEPPRYFRNRIDDLLNIQEVTSELVVRDVKPIKTFRSISGRRLRRTSTFVTIGHTGRYVRQSGVSCFETRR